MRKHPDPSVDEDLCIAVLTFDEKAFNKAIEGGASPNARMLSGLTALQAAVTVMPKANSAALNREDRAINKRMIKQLLSRGADVHATISERNIALLHMAAMRNVERQCARDLIKAGADLNARDKDGLRPIDVAKAENAVGVAGALIEAGADTAGVDETWLRSVRTSGHAGPSGTRGRT